MAFWHVIQFARDVATEEAEWRNLRQCAFSGSVGVQSGMSLPNADRRRIWFSGDAARAVSRCFARFFWKHGDTFTVHLVGALLRSYHRAEPMPTSMKSSFWPKWYAQ